MAEGVRLYHIRHGQTDWNAEGRLQGQTDIPMNAVGRAQAARNGAALAAHFAEHGIAADSLRYVASPLGRAQATMRIVRTALGLGADPFDTEPALIEVDFGAWSGFTIEELKQNGQEALVHARRVDKWGFVPPGGESYAVLSQRVAGWLATVRTDLVVVSHGGVSRVMWGLICGVPAHEVPLLPAAQDTAALFLDGRVHTI